MRRPVSFAVLGIAALLACGPAPFDPQSYVDNVRVLASRTDLPYAMPGEDVNVDLLVVDGRADQTKPVTVGWLPFLCLNPTADLYYACFAPGARVEASTGVVGGTVPAGVPGGSGAGIDLGSLAGTDITDFLVKGNKFSFTMPTDAIVPHTTAGDYGLVMLFNIACAGRVRIATIDPAAGQQQMPLECVGDGGVVLDATQYTVGFTRVYAYADRRNGNPTIDGITYKGQPVDLAAGVTVPLCTEPKRADCDTVEFDVQAPASDQEDKTGEQLLNGNVPKEQVYAQYYSTRGFFAQDARLLYDSQSGLVTDRAVDFIPPAQAGGGRIYVVVKDDRGGTTWTDFPVQAQ